MCELEQQLYNYLISFLQRSDEAGNDVKVEIDLDNTLKCDDNWNIFFENSFDASHLKRSFTSLSNECRMNIFKFGITCMIGFIRSNFTGPDFDKDLSNYFKSDKFESVSFDKLLSVNNEDINVNTKFPVLLVTSKIIFEWCIVDISVNNWWYWRSIWVHQQILDELSPTLLLEADDSYKLFEDNLCNKVSEVVESCLCLEVAQLYLLFRNISKAKEYITAAKQKLGIQYDSVGILGKRTKYQEGVIAQLALKVTIEKNNALEHDKVGDNNVLPKDLPLEDDVRLNKIEYDESIKECTKVDLCNLEQKFFLTIVEENLIATPKNELQSEELMPFIDMILAQNNSFVIRIMALLLRCKLQSEDSRSMERSLRQLEEIINSWNVKQSDWLNRIHDVFSTGLPPMWRVESQYADLLLNMGLVKNALDIYLKLKLWEEVIVCYTILKMRHKAAEIIREQLNQNPTVKLWCLLGDATDEVSYYEKAWEMSKRRSHRAQRHWGNYLYNCQRYAECIPHFEKSVSINPLQANVWSRLGYAALQVENWQTAATAYRRYTTIEPDNFKAWNNLAQAYIKIGNKRNAHQAILEALRCNFDNWKVWENLLVVSCDISNFSDVIRAYHSLLDLKEKYLNIEVLSMLVYNVCNDLNDCEGQPAQRFLQKTRQLLGRVTAAHPGEGYVWELYASVAPSPLLRAQRLQRAYRGFTQGDWDKNPATCRPVLYVCIKLASVLFEKEIDPRDTIVNSIRLNLSAALAAVRKHDWEETRDLVKQVSEHLELIMQKIKDANEVNEKTAS